LLAVIVAPEQIIRLAAELASMQPEESPQAWHGKLLDLLQDDAAKAKPSDD
jgi:hypothetical protein